MNARSCPLPITNKIGNPLVVDGLMGGVQQILEQPKLVGAKSTTMFGTPLELQTCHKQTHPYFGQMLQDC